MHLQVCASHQVPRTPQLKVSGSDWAELQLRPSIHVAVHVQAGLDESISLFMWVALFTD